MGAPASPSRTIVDVWSGRERVVAGALALACAVTPAALSPEAAGAQDVAPAVDAERLAAYDEALVAVTQELSYVVLLGWAAQPVPPDAREMPEAIGIERMDTAAMIDAVRYLDQQRGPDALKELRELGEPITPPIELVLGENLPFVVGEVPEIGAGVYLQAWDDLLAVWSVLRERVVPTTMTAGPAGPAPTGATAPTVTTAPSVVTSVTTLATTPATTLATTPATADPVVADSSDESAAPAASAAPEASEASEGGASDSGTGGTLLVVLALLVGVLLAVGVVLVAGVVRRSHRAAAGPSSDPLQQDEVLDAGRRIMAASDVDGFASTVAEQVRRLVGADGAVVIDGQVWNPAGRELPDASAVDRVLSTGRLARTGGTVVVPVVADGRVVGALMAWTAEPRHAEVLGAFAPIVGAALQGLRARVEHEHLAFDDALTGVGNRRRFDRDLERLVGAGSGRGMPVALAMVDVDHFKRFNDTHGHPLGDAVLRHVAAIVSANVRESDLVYRYGGEEFAVLLPGAELDEARAIVERVRAAVAASPFTQGDTQLPPVTVSVGVSSTPPVDGPAMVRTADGALYAAKSNGRNRVEVCPPQ